MGRGSRLAILSWDLLFRWSPGLSRTRARVSVWPANRLYVASIGGRHKVRRTVVRLQYAVACIDNHLPFIQKKVAAPSEVASYCGNLPHNFNCLHTTEPMATTNHL